MISDWVRLTLSQPHVVEEFERACFRDTLPNDLYAVKWDFPSDDVVRQRRAERERRWREWQFIRGDWS